MRLSALFEQQKAIERQLLTSSGIVQDSLGAATGSDLRFLALQVKLSELANLTKCYKYGAQGNRASVDKLTFRYIEVMRYILSLGIYHDFADLSQEELPLVSPNPSLTLAFLEVFSLLENFKRAVSLENYFSARSRYAELMAQVNALGEVLSISASAEKALYGHMRNS